MNEFITKLLIARTPALTFETITKESKRLFKAKRSALYLRKDEGFVLVSPKSFESVCKLVSFVKRKKPFIKDNCVIVPLIYKKKTHAFLIVQFTKEPVLDKSTTHRYELFSLVSIMAIRKALRSKEAKRLEEIKKLFVSLMSHEIRTPLTTIYGYAQLLNKNNGNLTDQQHRWIHNLFFETTRMSMMLEELLQLHQIEDGTFNVFKTKITLADVMEDSLKRFHALYPDYEVIYENTIKGQDSILGDRTKLVQVIVNALHNAARFSPLSKEVSLILSKHGREFVIVIVDWGEGMEQKKVSRLTADINKGVEGIRGGNGLSLVVVKAIVEAHGGKLKILSRKKVGTTIEVKLPSIIP